MKRVIVMLTSAIAVWLLGAAIANAETSYGFLYNGVTYTTIAVPGATDTFASSTLGADVAGWYTGSGGTTYGFMYDGITYTTIAPPGASSTVSLGVSSGFVVGYYYDSSGTEYGFLYGGRVPYTTLTPPEATATVAEGIQAIGEVNPVVVGYYVSGGSTHGFLYNGGTYTTLSVPGATDTYAVAISGSYVTGYYVITRASKMLTNQPPLAYWTQGCRK
jgi:hypothetical protein